VVAASIRDIFSANLSRILAKKQVNQRELALALGVAAEVISHWKAGRAFPQTRQLDNLVKQLDIHPEELFLDPSRVRLAKDGEVEPAIVEALRQALKSSGYDVTIEKKR
jgi:transcriptional regulator with XRE-family HTH domain